MSFSGFSEAYNEVFSDEVEKLKQFVKGNMKITRNRHVFAHNAWVGLKVRKKIVGGFKSE